MYRTGWCLLAWALLAMSPVAAATGGPVAEATNPLLAERDRSRPLVVVAPDPSDPHLLALADALARPDTADAFAERQIVVFTVIGGSGERAGRPLDPAATSALLASLGLRADGPATARLIGKDGGVKLHGNLSVSQIIATVDAMPMRRRERREQ